MKKKQGSKAGVHNARGLGKVAVLSVLSKPQGMGKLKQ